MPSAFSRSDRNHIRLIKPAAEQKPDDEALVQAARARSAFGAIQIWQRYSTLVRRILQRSLGPSVDVEDALQETFLRLFRDIESLREPTALRSFLIGIALHVATSELRRRRARRWLLLSDDGVLPDSETITEAHHLEEREALQRLYRVLERIDTRRRHFFVLRYIEGLELGELSTVMRCSLATTKRRTADAARRVCRLAAEDPVLAPYLTRKS
ncbi:MAG: RNA polymerase sigma factor [Deltaproteobacteria bacterium]|nr:RNA polymerase sigma factor [Deltaproteobacteria bacterium]